MGRNPPLAPLFSFGEFRAGLFVTISVNNPMTYPRIFLYNASVFSIIISDLNCFAVSLAANATRCLKAVSLKRSFIFSSASSMV